MTSAADTVVSRWLEQQHSSNTPVPPDSLHPADAFPLATLSNPPSSSGSDLDSYASDGRPKHPTRAADVAQLVHPPSPGIMDEQPATNHARRRSSSLAGASVPPPHQSKKKHRRRRSDNIIEEGEDRSSDSDHSDSSAQTDSTDFELDDMSNDGLEDDEETGLTGRDRRRRRRRKRRNTLLDQRVVSDVKFTKEEEKAANQTLFQSLAINAILIGLWCVSPLCCVLSALCTPPHACTDTAPPGTCFLSPSQSTTSGCSRRKKATARPRTSSHSRYLRLVCT